MIGFIPNSHGAEGHNKQTLKSVNLLINSIVPLETTFKKHVSW